MTLEKSAVTFSEVSEPDVSTILLLSINDIMTCNIVISSMPFIPNVINNAQLTKYEIKQLMFWKMLFFFSLYRMSSELKVID